jgi:hypothetical protein
VLGNRACPLAEKVVQRPALCMMTSNVFGTSPQKPRVAKVVLEQAIAQGDGGGQVVVYLRPSQAAQEATGRQNFKADGSLPIRGVDVRETG